MKIVIGSVVKGFILKSALAEYLKNNGHDVIDVGCHDTSVFVKFPSIAERAARVLQKGGAELGVLVCGSGTGMMLCANRYKGVCAICAESPMTAELGRKVNDANVLTMGESQIAPDMGCRIVQAFLDGKFQDAPPVPENIKAFWAEARDPIVAHGIEARDIDMETLG